ncbi:Molybdenum cofactor biosynthesis, MoeB [Moelleriella libera RCEF 2490]|uniref:NEDD8-activating enzyme E1 regulatory subunit n=1 Tax=Moelleriella libera RCEF 2490 TaxID=1081109 RepID=A0A166VGS8_9HYPO|nr:Molybdenum cofactor biosynthesis, MoeB [Moelleriella libera RCEF 2490]
MDSNPNTPAFPTDKERKYDRQLRLWAASGQAALESANVLLVNTITGNSGIETLKNLVLPGIGRFTIADDAVVQDSDLGVNFFLDETCLGMSRAYCCKEYLIELNPDVTGEWFPRGKGIFDLEQLIESSLPFTVILYTLPLCATHLAVLKRYATQNKIPLLAVQNAGYYGYFTIELPELFPVVETHPEQEAIADLRLLDPWPELSIFAANMTRDIDIQDDLEHGHLPFVVILLHYLERWKNDHEGCLPLKFAEKVAFRNMVARGARRDNPEGGEENFDEAVSAVMKHVCKPSLPANLEQIFEYREQAIESSDDHFWIIAGAIERFWKKHGQLPLQGGVPDMKAQSDVYIRLQQLYRQKAKEDASEVMALLPNKQIDEHDVELFCRNAKFVKLIRSSKDAPDLAQIVVSENESRRDELAASTGLQTSLSLLPVFLALNSFAFAQGCMPEDIVNEVTKRIPTWAGNRRLQIAAEELSRARSGDLHNISAFVGGMVAQEMIKIITKHCFGNVSKDASVVPLHAAAVQ